MRLGEIKQKIDRVIDENKTITIKSENVYGGQAKEIGNYNDVMEAIILIASFDWSGIKKGELINQLLSKYPVDVKIEILPIDDFNKLNNFVNQVNQKLPIFYSILETFVTRQEEQTINIKLPIDINSISKLSELNNRFEKLFKKFAIDGNFEFRGFDKGTAWYEIYINGALAYPIFIACLKIAQDFFNAREAYYNSEKAKLDYKAALSKKEDYTDEGLKKYTERRLELEIEEKINEAVEKINKTNGYTKEELCAKLISATKDLVKELGEGVEFHLSFNPPVYATEINGSLEIDYQKIQAIKAVSAEQKQIAAPKEETQKDEK